MLDKSLPYQGFIMKLRRAKLQEITVPDIPQGYHYRLYMPGDDIHWARLEHSVAEFSSYDKALDYFNGTEAVVIAFAIYEKAYCPYGPKEAIY